MISSLKYTLLGAGIGTASLMLLYRQLRTTHPFEPSIAESNAVTFRPSDNALNHAPIHTVVKQVQKNKLPDVCHTYIKNKPFAIHKGISLKPEDNLVYLFVRGYAKTNGPPSKVKKQPYDLLKIGGGVQGAFIQCHDNIVPDNHPVISFDLPDCQKHFAFGGHKEVKTLECIYNEICNAHDSVEIVLIGDCRGGKVALDWLTQKPKRVKAVVLMAPFLNGKELSDTLANNHLSKWPPFCYLSKETCQTFLHKWFFQTYYPSYQPDKDTLYERLAFIDSSLPILLAYRTQDKLVPLDVIKKFKQTIKSELVHTVATEDTSAPHSKLTNLPEIQQAVHSFFKEHGLPHNPTLSNF